MGKGARNRLRRKEAFGVAMSHGRPERAKPMARYLRRQLLQMKRRKHPSKPKGPRVFRSEAERATMDVDTDRSDSVGRASIRSRILRR